VVRNKDLEAACASGCRLRDRGFGWSEDVIVISEENIDKTRKRADLWSGRPSSEIWRELIRRAIQWIHEARPIVRIVVMTEPEIKQWWEEKRNKL